MSTFQAQQALELANRVRTRRAEVRAQIRDLSPQEGAGVARGVLTAPEPDLRTMTVCRLLMMIRRYGRVRALRVLRRASVSEAATLGGLTDRQREALRATLDQPKAEAVVEGQVAS